MAKKKCPEFENHERWLVSFADMLTLLFATFVTLYALNLDNSTSTDEEAKLAGSMQEAFNTPLEDIPLDRRTGQTDFGWGVFENMKDQQIRDNQSTNDSQSGNNSALIEKELRQFTVQLEQRLYGPEKFRKTEPGSQRVVNVQRTQRGMKVSLMGRHFFEPGEVEISTSAKQALDAVVATLKELGRPITIEGHTDNIPPKGSYSNWELSALRATNVLRYFVRKHGFPKSQLSVAGFADIHPIAHNGSEAGRSLNRRIEIKVHYE